MRKSLAIVGEGLTEQAYFDSLRVAMRLPFKIKPSLPTNSDIRHMAETVLRLIDEGYDIVYCLVDMDRIESNAAEKAIYKKVTTDRKYKKIRWICTFPCTEFWFLLHFIAQGETRRYTTYNELVSELRSHMSGYEKTKKYFKKTDLYKCLTDIGNLPQAVVNAKTLQALRATDGGIDYSEIFKVIEMIQELEREIKEKR